VLIGREQERQRLAALLEEARRGRSGALAVVGDPGVGKTALLEDARDRAADLRLLTATGVESESELPFASLHELLAPLVGLLPRIPPAQASALAVALSLDEGVADTLAVSAGTLSLLVEAAEEQPVVVVLDDVHWFDHASAHALAFATRRLRAEQIAVVAAFRPNTAPAFDGFPQLSIGPLEPDHARSLLRTRPTPVTPADEARILAAAEGNPLVLLELPTELADDLPPSSTHNERLERTFGRRVSLLPDTARHALLLAAAEPDTQTVRRATGGGQTHPLAPAETAGLVRVRDGAVTFRHPVIRSLVYSRATAGERAAAHGALAAVLTEDADRDRRAWHLGAAADDVDEEVAALLEETADRAITRGGQAAAARALERAARLSPDPAERARRLHAAAWSTRRSVGIPRARALIEEALALAPDPLVRFDLLFELRTIGEWTDARESDTALLEELLDHRLDDDRRVKLLILVVNRRTAEFDAAGAVALVPEIERYANGAGPELASRASAVAGIAFLLAGKDDEAIRCLRGGTPHPDQPTMLAFEYLSLEWLDELRASLATTFDEARRTQNLHRMMWNRSCTAHLALREGRLGAAEAAAAEAIRLGELRDDPRATIASAALAGVHAWRGAADQCLSSAHRALDGARTAGDLFSEGLARGAIALLALGLGRPADAIAALEPPARAWATSTVGDPSATPFIPDLVEAYGLGGREADARELLDRFAPLAARRPSIWMLAACTRCEGLLAPSDAFEEPFARALALLERSPYSLEVARTRLALGERLRRAGNRRAARAELEAAHDAFAAAGAGAWQQRAAAELRAIGVRVSSVAAPAVDLTPQELAIATLAAEGRSNKEIAAAVYLSPKTVEYHLANTFRKLNIHSRVELARIIPRND